MKTMTVLFVLLAMTAHAVTIESGDTLTGAIVSPGVSDQYTFAAVAGDTVQVRMVGTNIYSAVELWDLIGRLLASATSSPQQAAEVTCTLTNSGTFTIICKSGEAHPSTGPYCVSMVRMTGYPLSSADSDLGPISSGEVLMGTLNRAGDLDAATFAAVAGDTVQVRMVGTNIYSAVELWDLSGRLLASATSSPQQAAEVTCTLTNSGTFTIICKSGEAHPSTGIYWLSVNLFGGHTPDDIDGDGVSNKDELNAWTDPFSAASVFRITNVVLMSATNRPAFSWQTVGSMRYRVQYSDNLSPAIFTDIVRSQAQETESDVPEGLPHWQDFTDSFAPPQGSPTNGVRFYRVRIVR